MALDELFTNIVLPLLFIATERGCFYSTSSIENDLRSFGAARAWS
jgi:hypothetical protein